jgi:hypothetical protein
VHITVICLLSFIWEKNCIVPWVIIWLTCNLNIIRAGFLAAMASNVTFQSRNVLSKKLMLKKEVTYLSIYFVLDSCNLVSDLHLSWIMNYSRNKSDTLDSMACSHYFLVFAYHRLYECL